MAQAKPNATRLAQPQRFAGHVKRAHALVEVDVA